MPQPLPSNDLHFSFVFSAGLIYHGRQLVRFRKLALQQTFKEFLRLPIEKAGQYILNLVACGLLP